MKKEKKLSNIVQKKLFWQRFGLNFSITWFGLFLLNTSISTSLDIKQRIENKESFTKLKLSNIINLILFYYLFNVSLKLRKQEPDVLLRKPSAAKPVLDDLRYFYDKEEDDDIYSSLKPKDIENLCKKIDFSPLSDSEQYAILQGLIVTAHNNPVVAKILKSNLLPSTLRIDDSLLVSGQLIHGEKIIKKGHILIQDHLDITAVAHELFHTKQCMDGAFLPKELRSYASVMTEAQAKALNLILTVTPNHTGYFIEYRSEINNWVKQIRNLQLFEVQKENLPLSRRAKIGKAQERTMGIIMKCLIEGDEGLREQIAQSLCKNQLSKWDLAEMHFTVANWRDYYIKEGYEIQEEKLKKILPSLSKELKLIPLLNEYYSEETGIPQSLEAVKIDSSKPSALYEYLNTNKQKTK